MRRSMASLLLLRSANGKEGSLSFAVLSIKVSLEKHVTGTCSSCVTGADDR